MSLATKPTNSAVGKLITIVRGLKKILKPCRFQLGHEQVMRLYSSQGQHWGGIKALERRRSVV